jgi:hypothetical protein
MADHDRRLSIICNELIVPCDADHRRSPDHIWVAGDRVQPDAVPL